MERGYMKSEDEQMLQRIMDIDTMGYACIYDSSGKREEYLIALTAENLANLIGGKGRGGPADQCDRCSGPSDGRQQNGDAGQLPGSETVQEDQPVPGIDPEGRKRGGGDPGRVQGRDGRILCCERESGHLDRIPDAIFYL